MSVPTGTTGASAKPARALLQRIDIGLTTGIIAVFIAFLSLLVAHSQTKMALQAQKASVLPIIDIDFGYEGIGSSPQFVARLTNVGAGLANVQRVRPLQNGEPIETIQAFDDAIMNRRMRGNVGYPITSQATGYLRAGDVFEPRRYRMAGAASELGAYLRGKYGPPLDGLDLDVCYCSVFDDCWTVTFKNRQAPKAVKSCGIKDTPVDYFQNYIDQTAAKRLEK